MNSPGWAFVHGDSLATLKQWPDNHFDSLVSDPPSGTSFMNRDWDCFRRRHNPNDVGRKTVHGRLSACAPHSYGESERENFITAMTAVFAEALRTVKPGGYGLVWALPRTSHWTATALENAGWEVRDVINHVFAQGMPKSQNVGKFIDLLAGAEREVVGRSRSKGIRPGTDHLVGDQWEQVGHPLTAPATAAAKEWDGWGTALKPATEMWIKCRKPWTTTEVDALLSDASLLVRGVLCQLLSASLATSRSRLSPADSEEAVFVTAQWLVDVFSRVESAEPFARTAMFRSPEVVSIGLSIGWLWKSILDALCGSPSMFTTEIETGLITDLQTLNSSLSPITRGSILKGEILEHGSPFDVAYAVVTLSEIAKSLRDILMRIAPALVTGSVASSPQSGREPYVFDSEMGEGGSSRPATEHWIKVRKPLSEKSVARNVLKHGTGAINIDACRVERAAGDVPGWHKTGADGSAGYLGEKGAFNIRAMSAEEVQERCGDKGRWPPNLVLSHDETCGFEDGDCAAWCPVAAVDRQGGGVRAGGVRPNRRSGMGFRGGKGTAGGVREVLPDGPASRYFPTFAFVPKPCRREKEAGLDELPLRTLNRVNPGGLEHEERFKPIQVKNNHPTVKAKTLMAWLITLVTPPGGTVLDPFMGSGSTGVAAVENGFGFFGIEQDAEYCEIAQGRIAFAEAEAAGQRSLFDEE